MQVSSVLSPVDMKWALFKIFFSVCLKVCVWGGGGNEEEEEEKRMGDRGKN